MKLNILLIDDDEDEFILTKKVLNSIQTSKYDLTWESDYDAAGKLLKEQCFDVYLVDFNLGIRNGLELLKESFKVGAIFKPVLILTGQDLSINDLEFIKNGASDYLLKSEVNAQSLERSIR